MTILEQISNSDLKYSLWPEGFYFTICHRKSAFKAESQVQKQELCLRTECCCQASIVPELCTALVMSQKGVLVNKHAGPLSAVTTY